jgi:hypothetical protein
MGDIFVLFYGWRAIELIPQRQRFRNPMAESSVILSSNKAIAWQAIRRLRRHSCAPKFDVRRCDSETLPEYKCRSFTPEYIGSSLDRRLCRSPTDSVGPSRPGHDRRHAARIVDTSCQPVAARSSPTLGFRDEQRVRGHRLDNPLLGQRLQQSESFRPIAQVAIRVEMPPCSNFGELTTPSFGVTTRIVCAAIGGVGAAYNNSRKR